LIRIVEAFRPSDPAFLRYPSTRKSTEMTKPSEAVPRRHRLSRPVLRLATLVLAILIVPATVAVARADTTDLALGSSAAQRVVAAMQPGWNLGNTYDAVGADETAWGNPPVSQALLKKIKSEGFRSIRIPVTWEGRQGAAPDYTIDPAWLAKVRQSVDWAMAEGLYVMINLHHDSWMWIWNMPSQHDTVLARFNATWTQLADTFRGHSKRLLFESVNEPQFTGSSGQAQDMQLLHELNVSFHGIVRQSGGNNATRLLVLPTLNTGSDQPRVDGLVQTFNQLDDPNLVATVHDYGFWPFSVNIAGYTRFNSEVQNWLMNDWDRVHNAFTANGIPVIVGEYGLLSWDSNDNAVERGEELKFFEFFGHYARAKQFTTMLWDNGGRLDRTSFQWRDPDLIAQIKSSWTTRSGTASDDFVFTARSSAITDKTLTLNLNGTRFRGLRHDGRPLANGTDYTISGDQLTLKAAALSRLMGNRAYGVNATLEAHFSKGVPWRIDVVTYDTPIQDDATGTTDEFTIPTRFRGDRLATMEATYVDGGNAGPHNWTSFKEFEYTFTPDYSGNRIRLKPLFFTEVDDARAVTLTFHFWSGATVTYQVTKTGSSVTGTAG
jgi:endoglucanase